MGRCLARFGLAIIGGVIVAAGVVVSMSAVINERVCKRVIGTDDFNSLE